MSSCLHPINLRTVGGHYELLPCGKCTACLARRRSDWFIRLLSEFRSSISSFFVTISIDEDHINGYSVHRIDTRNFIRRLRPLLPTFRYFGVSEYGDKSGRPHYHVILFFNTPVTKKIVLSSIQKVWTFGKRITVDPTNERRLNYTAKYCLKGSVYDEEWQEKPFIFSSRKPPIGYKLLTDEFFKLIIEQGKTKLNYYGYERPVPKWQRQALLNKLPKSIRELYQLKCYERRINFISERNYNNYQSAVQCGKTYNPYSQQQQQEQERRVNKLLTLKKIQNGKL